MRKGSDKDILWTKESESQESAAARGSFVLNWLWKRKEVEIGLVGHGGIFEHMMLKNEAKKRNVPASLTSELEEHQNRAQELTDEINKVPSYNQTRDLIMQRLGGPFDYSQFTEDIRKLKVERE